MVLNPADGLQALSLLDSPIPGKVFILRELVVLEDGAGSMSYVSNHTLQIAFRVVRDTMLENALDLE